MKFSKCFLCSNITLTVMMLFLPSGAVHANEFDWHAHMTRNEERIRMLMQNPERNVWVEDIDPAMEFASGYTGLGSDILTIVTANDIASVWPAWNSLSPYIERYALIMLAYDCINDAFTGNANAAAWRVTKFAYGKFLSNMSAGGPVYAAYINLIDFGLDYLGNAVVGQISEDYWRAYCEFHFKKEKKDLSTLLNAFETGGLGGLERSLDTFWSDSASAGIRGYYTQKVHDPDFKQNFRWRFIREFMAAELLNSLAEKQTEMFIKQRRAAREMAEQMQRTKIRVTVPVVERGTGQPAKGYTARLSVRTRSGTEKIATVPVNGQPLVTFEFPYTALLTDDHLPSSTPSFHISIVPDEGTIGNSPQRYFNLFGSSRRAQLTVSELLIECRILHSFEVNSLFPVTIKVNGKLPARGAKVILRPFDTIRSHGVGREAISLTGSPAQDSVGAPGFGGDGDMPEGWVEEGTVQDGIARYSQIPAGRYWFELLDAFHGPYIVDAPSEFSIQHAAVTASDAGSIHAEPPSKEEVTALAENEFVPAINGLEGTLEQHIAVINETGAELWARFMAAATAAKRDAEAWRLRANEVSGHDEQSNRMREQANQSARARMDDYSRLFSEMNNLHRNVLEMTQNASAKALEGRVEIEPQHELLREYNELRHLHRDQSIQPLQQIQNELLRGFWQHQPDPEAQLEAAEAAVEAARSAADRTRQARSNIAAAKASAQQAFERNNLINDFFQGSGGMQRYTQLEAAAVQLERNQMQLDAEEASRQVERYRQRIESRRRMERRMRELLAQIDEALAALPEIDPAEWSAALNDFSEKHKTLIAAVKDSVTSDDENDPWKSLQEKTEQWLLARVEFCGDLLPEPLRTENSYSEFFDLFNAVKPFSSPYVPREWFGTYRAAYNSKVASRNQAVEPLIELHNEIALMATITPAADRAEIIKRLITKAEALISPDRKVFGQERIDELIHAKSIMDDIPQSMLGGLPAAWDAARRQLVQDGTLERLAKASGQPYIVIESYNENPVEKPFFWPESVVGGPRHELVLRLENVPAGDFSMVSWYLNEAYKNPARREGRNFKINAHLQQASNFKLDVMLSEGELFQSELFPAVLFP